MVTPNNQITQQLNNLESLNLSPQKREEIEKREQDFSQNYENLLSFLPPNTLGSIRGSYENSGNIQAAIDSLRDSISNVNLLTTLKQYIETGKVPSILFQQKLLNDINKTADLKAETLDYGKSVSNLAKLASDIDKGIVEENSSYTLEEVEKVLQQAEQARKSENTELKVSVANTVNRVLNSYNIEEDYNDRETNNSHKIEASNQSVNTIENSINTSEQIVEDVEENLDFEQYNDRPEFPLLKEYKDQGRITEKEFGNVLENLETAENKDYKNIVSNLPSDLSTELSANFDETNPSFTQKITKNKEKYYKLLESRGDKIPDDISKESNVDALIGENFIEVKSETGEILPNKSETLAIQTASKKLLYGKKIHVPDDKQETYDKAIKTINSGDNIKRMKESLTSLFNIVNQDELINAKSTEKQNERIDNEKNLNAAEIQEVLDFISIEKERIKDILQSMPDKQDEIVEYARNIDKLENRLKNNNDNVTKGEVSNIIQQGQEIYVSDNPKVVEYNSSKKEV